MRQKTLYVFLVSVKVPSRFSKCTNVSEVNWELLRCVSTVVVLYCFMFSFLQCLIKPSSFIWFSSLIRFLILGHMQLRKLNFWQVRQFYILAEFVCLHDPVDEPTSCQGRHPVFTQWQLKYAWLQVGNAADFVVKQKQLLHSCQLFQTLHFPQGVEGHIK